jgi:hypothetical protein
MSKMSSVQETRVKGHIKAVDALLDALSKTAKRLKKEGFKKGDAFRAASRLLEVEDVLFGHEGGGGHN